MNIVPKLSASNQEMRNPRQRNESGSSVGSWQMISGTGSLRSQDSNIIVVNEYHQQHNLSNNNQNNQQSSSHSTMCSNHQSAPAVNSSINEATSTIVDEDCFTANDYFLRRERLNSVRTLFYNCYASTIGYKFKNGNENVGLGSLLGNFAEKVGLTTQRTSV